MLVAARTLLPRIRPDSSHFGRAMSTVSSEEVLTIQKNIEFIKESIKHAVKSSKQTSKCRLVAVSKTKPVELIQACYSVGQRHFGENYVNELEEKSAGLVALCPDIRWHFIGKVQSNKIVKICSSPHLYCVETIESEKQCIAFEREMQKQDKTLNMYVQVNTSSEEQKGGIKPEDAVNLANFIFEYCPHLNFSGFMTIGSFDNSHEDRNPDFDVLVNTRQKWLDFKGADAGDVELSMGMSNDFLTAIAQGSTSVRVGSKIFAMSYVKTNFRIPLEDLVSNAEEKSHTEDTASFRKLCFKCGVFPASHGSAYVEFGKTRVLAQIHGPREKNGGDFHSGSISVTIAGYEKKLRAQLESSLSGLVQLAKYAKSEIEVEYSVISSDGGELQAALIAGSMALIHAGIEVMDVLVSAHISVSPDGKCTTDPSGEVPRGFSQVTIGLLPNINQIVCCDIRGAMRSQLLHDTVQVATKQALKLYPLIKDSLLHSLKDR